MRCDNRIPHVLVNLNAAMGDQAEAKCVSVNQASPEGKLVVVSAR